MGHVGRQKPQWTQASMRRWSGWSAPANAARGGVAVAAGARVVPGAPRGMAGGDRAGDVETPGKEVGEPGAARVEERGGLSTLHRADEHPVSAPERDTAQGVFHQIVADLELDKLILKESLDFLKPKI